MKQNYLFVITGPSGCGKTTLLRNLELPHRNAWGKSYWKKAEKHSTRLPRVGEKDIAGYSDVNTPDIKPSDLPKEIQRKKAEKRLNIGDHCNVIYSMNGELYGFNTSEIVRQLEYSHVAIVLSDFGVIKQLKENESYGLIGRVVTLYISSCVNKNELTDVWLSRYCDFQGNKKDEDGFINENNFTDRKNIDKLLNDLKDEVSGLSEISLENTPDGYKNFRDFYYQLEKVVEIQKALVPDNESYSVRVERLKNFYFKYIIDIGLFDYVILNYFDERKDDPNDEKMSLQAKNIIDYIEKTNEERVKKGQKCLFSEESRRKDAVFFVCAPPKSGKSILMKNLRVMSEKQIYVVKKQGLRERKDSDGEDMIPLIEPRNGKTEEFDIKRTEIEEFIEKDVKTYSTYMAKVNALKKEIESLRSANAGLRDIRGANAELEEVEKKFNEIKDNLLNEAKPFFGVKFQEWTWRFHDTYYGIDLPSINDHSKEACGKSAIPVIMISNMDELEAAHKKLGDRLVPIFLTYVATDESNREYHMGLVGKNKGYGDKDKASKILNEINDVKNQYYENIGKFRHVLLNSGIEEDLHDQIINIVRLYGGTNEGI